MPNIAVILSGCGFMDGAEIREAVITLLALDRAGANVKLFAPDINQADVINHLTGEPTNETRNVLVESARIARGEISDLASLNADTFDALLMPGGYGVAKNLSDIAFKGTDGTASEALKQVINDFLKQHKPIGVICISPAALVAAVRDTIKPTVTVGDDNDGLICGLGGNHKPCPTNDIVIDKEHNIVSCSAYMRNDSLANIASGIEKLVEHVLQLAGN